MSENEDAEPEAQPDGNAGPGDGGAADEPADQEGTRAAHRRIEQALGALSDDSLRALLAALHQHSRMELAAQLSLPKQTAHLGGAMVPLLRRKLAAASDEKRLAAAFTLAEACNDDTIAALGDSSDDPSRDDMLAVLPAIIERHGADTATLMLASYAASKAPCAEVFAELLDTDERFVLAEATSPPPENDDAPGGPRGVSARPAAAQADDAERGALLEQRRAAKAARREAARKQREASSAAEAKRREASHRARRRRP